MSPDGVCAISAGLAGHETRIVVCASQSLGTLTKFLEILYTICNLARSLLLFNVGKLRFCNMVVTLEKLL